MCSLRRVGSSLDLKRAHNPKVAGSNPAPATTKNTGLAVANRQPLAVAVRKREDLHPLDHFDLGAVGRFDEAHAPPIGRRELFEHAHAIRAELRECPRVVVRVDGDVLDPVARAFGCR